MTLVVLLLTIIGVVLLMIRWSRIYLTWELKRASHHNQLLISVSYLNLRIYKRKWTAESIDLISFFTTKIKKKTIKEEWINNIKLFKKLYPHLLTSRIHSFEWYTRLGTETAHYTAIYVGMLLSIKQILLTFLQQYLDFCTRPVMTVDPNFNQTQLTVVLKGTASINLKTALSILIHFMQQNKTKKG